MIYKERVLSSGVVKWRVDHYDHKVIFKHRVFIFGCSQVEGANIVA